MKQEAVVLNEGECNAVAEAFGEVTCTYAYHVNAAAVRPTHVHWILGSITDPVSHVVGRYKGVAGKAVRRLRGPGAIWTEGYFKVYLHNEQQMLAAVRYVEQHNLDSGLPARRWEWVMDWRCQAERLGPREPGER
jgi:REP element-mobilizing transposase RayT